MAVTREQISFGIEDTADLGGADILDVMGGEAAAATPDQIETIQEPTKKPTSATPNRAVLTEKDIKKEELDPIKGKPTLQEGEESVDDKDIEFKNVIEDFFNSEEKGDEEKSENEGGEEDDESAASPWKAVAKGLFKLDIFSPDQDEEGNDVEPDINSGEELRDRFISEINSRATSAIQTFLESKGDEFKDAFDAIFVKGVSPKEYYTTKNSIDNIKELDLTKESNQLLIVRKTLEDQELEPDDIEKELERLKNYGDLEEVSKRYHKVQVKREEQRLSDLAEKQQKETETRKKIESQFEDTVFDILSEKYKTKEFDGIPVNKQFAEKTMDMLTTKKYKLTSGELLTEFDKEILDLKRPENYATKVKLAMIIQLLKTDPSLSSIKRKAASQEASEVFNEVARHKFKNNPSAKTVQKERTRTF